jgi:hypothetical protein
VLIDPKRVEICSINRSIAFCMASKEGLVLIREWREIADI